MKRVFKSEYYELPNKYNKTIVKLLVQSPTRMYAYWDVSDETIQQFSQERYNRSTPYLKIENLTLGYYYEIKVDPFANNYYIEVTDSDCDYKVELLRKENGISHLISSSNTTHIPRSSPCDYNEDIIFRNCICLSLTDKFKLYSLRRKNLNKYTDLSFSDYDDTVSSMDIIK
ncbi:MAG: DUF4912 domain-containing protein [Clostridia bacterium]|nr:DUF4912 domain-containing protein [Clostridia bacterium]